MKDLRRLKYFQRIEVLLSQTKYVLDLLTKTGLLNCKLVATPMVVNHGLQMVDGGKLADYGQYQRIVGKLIYLSYTRPDIAYAVEVVSRFMDKLSIEHMEAFYRILRYLKGAVERRIL